MYEIGDILIDTVKEKEVVVTTVTSTRSDEYVVSESPNGREQTVHDYNKRYGFDGDVPVVGAVYAESLPADPHEVTKKGAYLLADNSDETEYNFPISRLILEEFRD